MTLLKNGILCAVVSAACALTPFISKAQTDNKAWVAKSNEYTKVLIEISKKNSPEFCSSQGLAQFDKLIAVPTLANQKAQRKEREAALTSFQKAKKAETNPFIIQDLEILINQLNQSFKNEDFNDSREVSYLNPTSTVFSGLQTLLDDQTPAERRTSAVIRLKKYAGLEQGYQPISDIYKERTLQQIAKQNMIYPS